MKLSLFTPTHKPTYLMDAYESLLENQHEGDWEWVIVPNGQPLPTIPERIARDPHVRIIPAPPETQGIGALKKFACECATGDYLIEFDHDDLLTPDALVTIATEASRTGAGFLYSDNVNFYANHSCQRYPSTAGWEDYPVTFRGRPYTAMRAFDPTPHSLYTIGYAPNHVRVWSRETYLAVGGHDPNLHVADDHDLICRTYLQGTKFHHIPQNLYMYRVLEHDQNSYRQHQGDVTRLSYLNGEKYTHALVEEWCRREKYPLLDLGGRLGCPPGYTSVDLFDADIVCDIATEGLPFPDSSVGCVRAVDFLEHIAPCSSRCAAQSRDGSGHSNCVVKVMNEIYRVLVPGGWLLSRTPSTDGRGAFQDPTHTSRWNSNSFFYYTDRSFAQYVPGITCRFQRTRMENRPLNDFHRQHNIIYVCADLVALKGQRAPGGERI